MTRKPTKTEIREQAQRAHEARMNAKQFAIIKVESERGWGFVVDVTPQAIIHLTPAVDLSVYSCLAYAFDREAVSHWAARIERDSGVKTTIIPVDERWDALKHSRNLVPMAQRYVEVA